MKEIYIKKKLIFNIILYNVVKTVILQEICNANIDCNKCNKCIIEQNSVSLCEYGNLFCKQNNKFLLFFSDLKSSYLNYFSQDSDINDLCGEQDIYLTRKKSFKIIDIGYKNEEYLRDKSAHCFYNISNLLNNEYELSILFSLHSENITGNNLSFSLYFNFANSNNFYYSDATLRNTEQYIKLIGINNFNIMIDIDKNNNEIIKEKLVIEILFQSNSDEITKHDKNKQLPTEIKENASSNKYNKDYKLYYILGGGSALLIIIMVVALKICLKRSFRNRNEGINLNIRQVNNNIDQNRKIENRKKIELLFNTKLYPIKYFKDLVGNSNNNCSICLENFIERKSIVSITSCKHVFHFECLKKWGEENYDHFKCPNCNYDLLKEDEAYTFISISKNKQSENNKIINTNNNNDLNSNPNYISSITNRDNINTLRSSYNLYSRNNFS